MRLSCRMLAILVATMFTPLTAASLEEAARLFEQRKVPQARAAFETLARSGPARAEAAFYLGRIELLGEGGEKAAKYFEQATALEPTNARYHFWLGRAFGQMAQNANPLRAASLAKKVHHAFAEAVRLDPGYLDAHAGLLDFYLIAPRLMGGGEDKAKAQLAAIERIDPAYAHMARARLHRREKKPELVTRELEAAVRRFPTDPRAHIWLSGNYAADEKWDAAIRSAAEAVRVNPAYLPGHYHVGRTAAGSGKNLAAGEESLKRYLAYVPKDDEPPVTVAHYQLGLIYERLGKNEQAAAELREALRRAPRYEEAKKALDRILP